MASHPQTELRTLIEEVRIFRAEPTSAPVIRMSIKFDTNSVPLGMFLPFREQIAPTAFDRALNDPAKEVLAYWNHNTDMPLGRRSANTVRIEKTQTLFKAEIDAPDTSWGRDAVTSIERGDVQGMSFRFRVPPNGDKWEEDADRNLIRTLVDVELEEVSPTPEPAYPKSSAAIRSAEEALADWRASQSTISTEQLAERLRRGRLHRDSYRRLSLTGVITK